jgi:hypothetical protein
MARMLHKRKTSSGFAIGTWKGTHFHLVVMRYPLLVVHAIRSLLRATSRILHRFNSRLIVNIDSRNRHEYHHREEDPPISPVAKPL